MHEETGLRLGLLFLAGKPLTRMDRIEASALHIMPSEKAYYWSSKCTAGVSSAEVSCLAATFNQMLDRLQDSFRRQRRFMADASHELRTPLELFINLLENAFVHASGSRVTGRAAVEERSVVVSVAGTGPGRSSAPVWHNRSRGPYRLSSHSRQVKI